MKKIYKYTGKTHEVPLTKRKSELRSVVGEDTIEVVAYKGGH
jgi:hypothetical protein